MANCTLTFCSGCPQLLVKVAVTVAVVPTPCVWVDGSRLNCEPAHGPVPTLVHCVDSLPLQAPPSVPPVLSTFPESMYEVVVPLMVTSTMGTISSRAQFGLIPMSDESSCAGPLQPSVGTGAVCVTIRLPPFGSTTLGQPLKVQLPTITATELTVTAEPLLLMTCTAPASKTHADVSGQPWKITFGDPAQGVGKWVTLGCELSAYPT